MSNLVQWIVEEVKPEGAIRTVSFQSYDEALDVYNSLKVESPDSFVSIEKKERKLLVE